MSRDNIRCNLHVTILREGKKFIAYTPALDLSTSGSTFEQAKKRFVEAVSIFFEETLKRGTLDEVFKELGWRKTKSQWAPPNVIACASETFQIPARV